MRIANMVSDSIVDGPGLRFTVFVQGCPHHCPDCHNPETHDLSGGQEWSVSDLARTMLQNPLTSGLTLSGGEPFLQAEGCAALAKLAHEGGLSVWTYTGFLYEDLLQTGDPDTLALLSETDVLVDGPFLRTHKSYDLLFRGSTNQRLIHVPSSRAAGRIVLWTRPDPLAQFTRTEI